MLAASSSLLTVNGAWLLWIFIDNSTRGGGGGVKKNAHVVFAP